jgi:hypothetical protein
MRMAQPSDRWRSLALAMVIGVIAGACAAAPSPEPASPLGPASTTSPIAATSAPTGAPTSATSGPSAPSSQNPSPSASGSPSTNELEISGTFESSSDVTNDDGAHVVHTVIHQTGIVTAKGAADGTLAGTASYVYRKDYKFVGEGCARDWTTGDVPWDVAVSGTWQKLPDLSYAIVLTPASPEGPGIPEDMMCLGDIAEHPIAWPFAGTLVNGVFDSRTDLIPPGSSGSDFSWVSEHLQAN